MRFKPFAKVEVAVVEVAMKNGASTDCVVERPPLIRRPPANVEVAVVVAVSEPIERFAC